MSFFTHEFEGEIEAYGVGKSRVIWYMVLFLPKDLEQELPFAQHPRLRICGEIAEVTVAGAWMPSGDGHHYFIVSPLIRKTAQVGLGSRVMMRFMVDDQDRVDMPDTFALALSKNPKAKAVWESLTAGKRRGFTHKVHAAKTDVTRSRRVQEILKTLLTMS